MQVKQQYIAAMQQLNEAQKKYNDAKITLEAIQTNESSIPIKSVQESLIKKATNELRSIEGQLQNLESKLTENEEVFFSLCDQVKKKIPEPIRESTEIHKQLLAGKCPDYAYAFEYQKKDIELSGLKGKEGVIFKNDSVNQISYFSMLVLCLLIFHWTDIWSVIFFKLRFSYLARR